MYSQLPPTHTPHPAPALPQVDQPFDAAKFNFTKAMQKEVLFAFRPAPAGGAAAAVAAAGGAAYVPSARAGRTPCLVFINVSPIEYGHVLLVPRALCGLNQVVDAPCVASALALAAAVGDPFFRLGYNSLGAYGTVNHMHFQGYFLQAPYPLERAPTCAPPKGVPASAPGGVRVLQLAPGGYPVRALVFEAGGSLAALADAVGRACQALAAANVPHNLMATDRGARVFLVPNAFSERKARGEVPNAVLDSQVDPATFEISGHMVMKRAGDYAGIDQAWCWRLLELASFAPERFERVAALALAGIEE